MTWNSRKLIEHICAAYGLAPVPDASITATSRGAVGRIWRLDLGTERFAVKELFIETDEESVRREVAFTTRFEAAGIRLPGSLPGTGGGFLTKLPADAAGGWLRLYRWIDGTPVNLADPGIASRVGDLLGRLHALALPPRGEADPWYETVPDPATWDRLADTALAHRAQWARSLAGRAGQLRDLSDLVTAARSDRLMTCHRDLHPDNVLISGSGELVLLDWDDVGPACPGRELARLLADWLVHDGSADDAAVRCTLASYVAAGGPGRIPDERPFGMLIASMLNFLQRQVSVALDPGATREDRQYAAAEISDTLTRLPTPALMAQLIRLAAAVVG